jgi:hypothetical protein
MLQVNFKYASGKLQVCFKNTSRGLPEGYQKPEKWFKNVSSMHTSRISQVFRTVDVWKGWESLCEVG